MLPPTRQLRHRRLSAFLIVCTVLGATAWTVVGRYDPAAWAADYGQLRAEMERSYANLEWSIRSGRVDLPALHQRTTAALASARSNREARAALDHFVRAFDDGHFRIGGDPPRAVAWAMERWRSRPRRRPTSETLGADACTQLGYGGGYGEVGGALVTAGATSSTDEGTSFQSALVPLGDGRTVGVVRISQMNEYGAGVECERAWAAIAPTLEGPCDDECERTLAQATGDSLLGSLRWQVESLRRRGAGAIAVDLAGNGGGSNWGEVAARAVTHRQLRGARTALIRGAASAAILGGDIPYYAALRDSARTERARLALDSASASLAALRLVALSQCDMSAVWTRGASGISCSSVLPATRFTTGAYASLSRGALGDSSVERALFDPLAYSQRGSYEGPLLVIVDEHTASAAEYFAAELRDNGAAMIVGQPTLGAGCGYVGAYRPLTLARSGLRVRMPNCVRLRADGTNELAGVTPDVQVAAADGDSAQGAALVAAMRRALDASAPPRLDAR